MASRRITDNEILAQIPAASRRADRARRGQPHAAGASFDIRTGSLTLELTNRCTLSIPADMIPGLEGAAESEVAEVQVGPAGLSLRWESLDVDVGVGALTRLVLGDRALLQAAGAAGGSARSEAKARAARRNGSKGGRPRGS